MTIDRRTLLLGGAATVVGAAAAPLLPTTETGVRVATALPPKRETLTARATGMVWTHNGRLYQDGENGTEIELMPYQVEWLNKWSDAEETRLALVRYAGQIG
jgi:ribosome modulation factor